MADNIVEIRYQQNGKSTSTNNLGMREMQSKVYEVRNNRFILVKAPPASGKSRAMMFVALDKLAHQGLNKVIVAVPEKTIGRSFANTSLMKYGFFEDWSVASFFNLCDSENEQQKVERFVEFFTQNNSKILVCTHSTLRFGLKKISDEKLNDVLIGIDEFHHTSADSSSGLGELIRRLVKDTKAHILAMTGSYFRGDGVPVLRGEDEALFTSVTYNYYQQLNGYSYLKSLGLGYHFYQGNYLTAIMQVLNTTKKTIIHIPSVRSKAAASMHKYDQVADIINMCGKIDHKDYNTGVTYVTTYDGRTLKFADLVEDDPKSRNIVQGYLQRMKDKDAVDIIIALGTAKEGFDWPYCEHCLTIGVRGSLTEIVQIIGRCTRDCEGKEHAQFTNLIAVPDATQGKVSVAVNDMLKAISASLLMEQVMAPTWKFKTKPTDIDDKGKEDTHTLVIKGLKEPTTERTKQIIENDLTELTEKVLSNTDITAKALGAGYAPEVINKQLIPKVIIEACPDLSSEEVEVVREHLVAIMVLKGNLYDKDKKPTDMSSDGDKFLKMPHLFININDLGISLIDTINPFQRAYEIMSTKFTVPVLKIIQDTIAEKKYDMSLEEAELLFRGTAQKGDQPNGPLYKYVAAHEGKKPDINDPNPKIKRLAMAYTVLKNYKIRHKMGLDFEEETFNKQEKKQ